MARAGKIAAWLLFLVVAGAALTLVVFLCTPAPLRIAQRLLEQTLKDQGVTLAFRSAEGSLLEGVQFEEVALHGKGGWALEARRLYVRLSLASILVQRPVIKELLVESPRLVLPEGWNSKGGPPEANVKEGTRLPRVSIRRLKIVDGQVEAPGLLAGDARFSRLRLDSFEGSVFLRSSRLTVKGKLLGARTDAPGFLPPVRVDGECSWQRGHGVELNVQAGAGGSRIALKGAPPRTKGTGEIFTGKVRLAPLELMLLRPVWPEAPERVAAGKFDVRLFRGRVEWSGKADVLGVGAGTATGWVAERPEGLGIGGTVETGGLALAHSGLLAVLDPIAPSISGKVSVKLQVDRGKKVTGTVEGRLGASKVAGFDLREADFGVRIAPQEVAISAKGDGPLAKTFSGQVVLLPEAATWHATAQAQSADLQRILQTLGLWKDPPNPFSLKDSWLRDVSVDLSGSPERVEVDGTALAYGDARVAFRLASGRTAPQLTWRFRCDGLAPEACGLNTDGAVSGEADFAGSDVDRGILEIRALASRVAGVSMSPFSAKLHLEGAVIRLDPVSLETDLGAVEARGQWTGTALALQGRFHSGDVAALAKRAGADGAAGSLDADWSLGLDEGGWSLRTDLRAEKFRYAQAEAAKIQGSAEWSSARGEGKVDLVANGLAVNKVILGDARLLLSRQGETLRGEFSGGLGEGRFLSAKLEGEADPAKGNLRLFGAHVQVFEGREFVQEGSATFAWDEGQIGLTGLKLARGNRTSALSFTLGRAAAEDGGLPISALFEAHGLPLNALPIPPSAGTVQGRVEANLSVKGTTASPLLGGNAHVEDGVFRFANSDLEYRPITLELTADGDRLKITRAHFTSPEGGEGAAVGWIRFRGLLPTEFLLEGSGGGIPFVVGREMVGRAQFYVKIHGTPAAPVIEGIAKVTKGRIELPELSRQAPLPPTVRFKNAPEGSPFAPKPQDEAEEPERRLTGRFQLDFEDVWVQSRLLLAQVEGRIVARLTPGGPALEGSVNVVEGRYLFMGKKFDLRDSRILFKGALDNVPDLDVTAKYEAPDYEVTARLTGSPERPVIALSSKPPLDQSDVLAVIMFGKPLKDLEAGQRQNWSAAAVAMAAQYQASPLLESGSTGLANLQVGVDDQTGGGTVGFSRYIGDRLVLEYTQVFGTLPEERLNLRYRINRKWSVEVETSSVGSSGGDLVWERRY